MTRTFVQTDHSTKEPSLAGAQEWMGEIESAVAVLAASPLGHFAPSANMPPDMTVSIGAGTLTHNLGLGAGQQTEQKVMAGQLAGPLISPVAHNRIDRIGISVLTGLPVLMVGQEAVSPEPPSYRDGLLPVCRVSISPGQMAITNSHIVDERSFDYAVPGPFFTVPQAGISYVSGIGGSTEAGFFITGAPANIEFLRITNPTGALRPGVYPVKQVMADRIVVSSGWMPVESGKTASVAYGFSPALTSNSGVLQLSIPGTYVIQRPVTASFCRITVVGAGGGAGGRWASAINSTVASGGGGGGGAVLPGLVTIAQDLTIVLAAGGQGGGGNTMATGANDAVAGSVGGTTTIAGSLGLSLSISGGAGGGRGVSTPAAGAAGAGAAAPASGFAGGAGVSGVTGVVPVSTPAGNGGACGEQLTLSPLMPGNNSSFSDLGLGNGGSSASSVYVFGTSGAGQNGRDAFVMLEWF